MLDFAKKYDYIPLHTDEEYAKKQYWVILLYRALCLLWQFGLNILKQI